MIERKARALEAIDEKGELLCTMSDDLWDHPETMFHEEYAAELFCKALEAEGFRVERDLAGIKTAFSGSFGSGGPVIGFLGEFDALSSLQQKADCTRAAGHEPGGRRL